MSPASPLAAGVREEIWRSLVSMLRVYANAATLGRTACTLNEILPDAVSVVSGEAELKLRFFPESGKGNWKLYCRAAEVSLGEFSITSSGALHLTGSEKEVDQAAIEWIEDLTRAGRQQVAI